MSRRMRSIATGGFTLVELLVVIGIIAVLASLVLAIGSGVMGRHERSQTEAEYTVLDQAIVTFEQARGQSLVFNRRTSVTDPAKQDGASFSDIDELPPGFVNEAYIMPRLMAILAANQASWNVLAGLSTDLLRHEEKRWPDGSVTEWNLRDPWGEQIAVVPAGRAATRGEMKQARELLKVQKDTKGADPLGIGIDLEDATVRTIDEWSLNTLCKGRQWLFISRGSDRSLGYPNWGQGGLGAVILDGDRNGIPDWDDNVCSYEPGRPGP
jgi:prepilin-type N-terminal cleavage/methylation domain-containing protein